MYIASFPRQLLRLFRQGNQRTQRFFLFFLPLPKRLVSAVLL